MKAKKPLTIQGKRVYTEEEWKEKNKKWEGDGILRREVFILVEWDDRSETPTERMNRLNNEVVEGADKMNKVLHRHRPITA